MKYRQEGKCFFKEKGTDFSNSQKKFNYALFPPRRNKNINRQGAKTQGLFLNSPLYSPHFPRVLAVKKYQPPGRNDSVLSIKQIFILSLKLFLCAFFAPPRLLR